MLAWFLATKVGRTVMAVGAGVLVVLAAIAHVFNAGRRKERDKAVASTLDNVKQKVQSDEAVDRLPASSRRDRLRQWSRD